MLALFTAMITTLIAEHICTADTAPTHTVLLHFAVICYIWMLKYVSVKLTKALVPTPVTDLLCDICGDIKGNRFGGKIDKEFQNLFSPYIGRDF
jgi:hypothetical protein